MVIHHRMRHGKVGIQLGCHQKYYISRYEEKQSIQLTITVVGNNKRERRELIDDVTQLLDDIIKVFMPEIKKPTLMIPCPLCPILHITLSEVSTGDTIFCPQSDNDASLHSTNDQLAGDRMINVVITLTTVTLVYCDHMIFQQTAVLSSKILTKSK